MLRITQINYENPYKMNIILNSPSGFQFNPIFPTDDDIPSEKLSMIFF